MPALMVDVTIDIPTMLAILIDQDRLSGDRNICEIFIICGCAGCAGGYNPGMSFLEIENGTGIMIPVQGCCVLLNFIE